VFAGTGGRIPPVGCAVHRRRGRRLSRTTDTDHGPIQPNEFVVRDLIEFGAVETWIARDPIAGNVCNERATLGIARKLPDGQQKVFRSEPTSSVNHDIVRTNDLDVDDKPIDFSEFFPVAADHIKVVEINGRMVEIFGGYILQSGAWMIHKVPHGRIRKNRTSDEKLGRAGAIPAIPGDGRRLVAAGGEVAPDSQIEIEIVSSPRE
jgi:hypothetical protein